MCDYPNTRYSTVWANAGTVGTTSVQADVGAAFSWIPATTGDSNTGVSGNYLVKSTNGQLRLIGIEGLVSDAPTDAYVNVIVGLTVPQYGPAAVAATVE